MNAPLIGRRDYDFEDADELLVGDLYVRCPKCRGNRYVSAITRPSNGFNATVWGEFPCDLCHMTGEAEAEAAHIFRCELADRDADE